MVVKLLCNTMFLIYLPFRYTPTNRLLRLGIGTISLTLGSIAFVFVFVVILGKESEQHILAFCRNRKEDNDVAEFESDSWSDDSGSDKLSRSLSNNSSKGWDGISEDSSLDQEGLWPMKDRHGCRYLQYIETASPYWRVPLMDKAFFFSLFPYSEPHCCPYLCLHHVVKSQLVCPSLFRDGQMHFCQLLFFSIDN